MLTHRNLAGIWIVRYKGVAYFTASRNIRFAIAFAYLMDGRAQHFTK